MSSLHNLPLQLTSFIGREREIADVKRLLSTSRLLTLTGAGGSGKTRLALQVVSQVGDDYPDGVYFVNLAPITDPALVVSSVTQTLDVKEAPGQLLIDTLKAYLRGKELLLVLDNFEHMMEAAPAVVDLLVSAPDVKVMVTSREPLHMQGEQLYQVPPMELPDLKRQASIEELSHNEAVALFSERARSAKSNFDLTAENAPVVAQICSRLDGLPLAIELAAARIRVLTPQAMLPRLDSRLRLLTGGATNLPARHQTLRNAIDWSYDLLSGSEQQLLRCMTVFQGGRTLEALEAVCNHDDHASRPHVDLLDTVESLVDKSMLRPRAGSDGETRYWLLVTIHEYALEKLQESGEEEALRREHALYFMRLVEEAEPHLRDKMQAEWLNRLGDEHDNIRAALRWANESGSTNAEALEIGLRTAGAMYRFWRMRSYFSEGKAQTESLLSLVGDVNASMLNTNRSREFGTAMVKVLTGASGMAVLQMDPSVARVRGEQALRLARELEDKRGTAVALTALGNAADEEEDHLKARSLYEEGMAIWRELGDKRGMGALLFNLGGLAYQEGNSTEARSLYEQSLALARETGDKTNVSNTLIELGLLTYEAEDYISARSLFEQGLALANDIGNRWNVAYALSWLGNVSWRLGDKEAARSQYEQGLELYREIGDEWRFGYWFYRQGLWAFEEGDYAAASSLFRQSLDVWQHMPDKRSFAVGLTGLGGANAKLGQAHRGAVLLGAGENILAPLGQVGQLDDRPPYEQGLESARAQLGEEAFEEAMNEGRAMSMEEAIAYALQGVPQVEPEYATSKESAPQSPAGPQPNYPNELSRREVEVLRLLAEGLTNKQIGERLFLAGNTVRAHLYSVYNKLDVPTRGAAIRFAADHGLI
jgi:predicted ATPase/DNA-binding CsgD family transcriptional regulator/Tfp pilus assembly protein PilF